jgi:hypothetical protein
MLLRRVMAHVRRQDWTAIGIDFLIVVIGVFVGIQVANWNDARLEDQRAQDILQRLSGDLEAELASIDQRIDYVGRSIDYGEKALAWAEDGTLADGSAWQTVLAFVQASRILPYTPVDTTYQEMRSAGQLGLVRDPALRAALTEYFVSGALTRADYILRLNPDYRPHVRGLTPYRMSRYIFTDCFKMTDIRTVATLPCASPVDEATAAAVLTRYREAPGLIVELAFWIDSAHQMVAILQQLRKACLDLKARIDSEIGKHG